MKKILIIIVLLIVSCHGSDRTNRDSQIHFDKICLEGHVYYERGYRLAIKLNNDGTPVRCMEKDKDK